MAMSKEPSTTNITVEWLPGQIMAQFFAIKVQIFLHILFSWVEMSLYVDNVMVEGERAQKLKI